MTVTRRGCAWALAALLGIAVTAGLTWSVSRLTTQRIGLSSQPSSVIRGLAPAPPVRRSAASSSAPRGESDRQSSPSTSTAPRATVTATTTVSPLSALAPVTTMAPAPPVRAVAPAAASSSRSARQPGTGGDSQGTGGGLSSRRSHSQRDD